MSYAADDPELAVRESATDLPLFGQPVPFQRASDTSREAAAALEHDVARVRQLVWLAYQKAGEAGLSADQAAEATRPAGYDKTEWKLVVRPRVTELFTERLIVKTDRRATNDSGQSARILRIR